MENKNVEQLLNKIKELSQKIDISNKDKLDKNITLKVPIEKFNSELLKSNNLKRVTLDIERNKMYLSLYNHYVMAIMSKLYQTDFNKVKNRLETTSEFIVFNRMVNSEVKQQEKLFLKGLI